MHLCFRKESTTTKGSAIMRTRLVPIAMALAAFFVAPVAAEAATGYATATVSFRAGPGVHFAKFGAIRGGAPIVVHSCTPSWCHCSYGGRTGYVSRNYVSFAYASAGPRYYAGPQYYSRPSFSLSFTIPFRSR